jgi:hypothetical protein
MKIDELPLTGEWEIAFGRPSKTERWFIEGESASGKSTFVMQLSKMLTQFGKVAYVSKEEGVNLSFRRRMERLRMCEVDGKFQVIVGETMEELVERIAKHKSPHFWVIDSVQYMGIQSFAIFKKVLLDRFPNKSFIFITQNYKGKPKGKLANDIKYDAGVKIRTEGFRAYCSGRFADNAEAYYTIWEEGAQRYYLNQ